MKYDDIFKDGRWLSKFKLFGKTESTRCGAIWSNINARTRIGGSFQKKNPTYIGSTNDFEDFQIFVEWCHKAHGFSEKNPNGTFWSLDKDIIVPGNLSYNPEACCFVPQRINAVLNLNRGNRGDYAIGVHVRDSGQFAAQASDGYKQQWIGQFPTEEEAHAAWQLFKRKGLESLLGDYELSKPVVAGIKRRIQQLKREYKNGEQTTAWI